MSSLSSGVTDRFRRIKRKETSLKGSTLQIDPTAKVIITPQANPATCVVGELSINSTGNKLMICTATNTWTVVGAQT